jgi:hypothetical protein
MERNSRAIDAADKCPECGEPLKTAFCSVCGWYPNEPKLSPGEIIEVAARLQQGMTEPASACQLLDAFCASIEAGGTPAPAIMEYLRTAFRAYRRGERELAEALGLSRPKGKPATPEDHQRDMAAALLRYRLDRHGGASHQEALDEVSKKWGYGQTVIGKSWAKYKLYAREMLLAERKIEGRWEPKEREYLKKIYENVRVESCQNCGCEKLKDQHCHNCR